MSKETYNKLENIFDYFSNNQNDSTFVDTFISKNSNISVNHYISNNGFNIYKYKDENGINNTIISKRKVNNIFSNEKSKSSIDTYFHKKEFEEGYNTISCIVGDTGNNNVAKMEYDSRTSWNNTFLVPPFNSLKGKDDSPSFLFEKAINYIGKNDGYKKSLYKDALNTYNDIINKTSSNSDDYTDSYESILAEEFISELQEDEALTKENNLRTELEKKSMDELVEIFNDLNKKIEKNRAYLNSLKYKYNRS